MPKKTLKEKIHAESRYKRLVSPSIINYSFTSKSKKMTDVSGQVLEYNSSDIRKTLILGIFFISLEIALAVYAPKWGW